tara:strand:- start:355 stop:573 length:219 start_codon:yes stop_codon:yes gene_type:complete
MDRLDRLELTEQLDSMVQFHQDKAIYYIDWLNEEKLKLSTIGFSVKDENLTTKQNTSIVYNELEQINGDEYY